MTDRLAAYAASLVVEWQGARSGRAYALTSAAEGEAPVFRAESADGAMALAVARLWDAEADPAAEAARAAMEERLNAGLVRGPYLLWVPPRARAPVEEPEASDFVQRVQQAAAPLGDGERGEVELPVTVQMAKLRSEGGYASVIGGLSRWWTLVTERVNGTFNVNSMQVRRAPQSAAVREALFARMGEASRGMEVGEAVALEATEAWTVQRLREEPLGERGFAIAQAPPSLDSTDGTQMRRIVRKRLQDAQAALAGEGAPSNGGALKAVALLASYEYAEHEVVGAFVKSLDPALFVGFGLVAVVADGEVRAIRG